MGNGAMATNRWMGNYYLDENGRKVTGYGTVNSTYQTLGSWILSGNRWQFKRPNGTFAKSSWIRDNRKWYYIDNTGTWLLDGNILMASNIILIIAELWFRMSAVW